MEEKSGWFDGEAFYEALDAVRQARSMTWKKVAAASGVSASTLDTDGSGSSSRCRRSRGTDRHGPGSGPTTTSVPSTTDPTQNPWRSLQPTCVQIRT